ncbi:uncharacterized protein METZ01_LOCUS331172 [marine metagenome]|uniref:Uncharacterized protein n=1 Tax=marine metagenome TaxID=408172 RepID=A0A382Q0A3_9ZZZZ
MDGDFDLGEIAGGNVVENREAGLSVKPTSVYVHF